MVWVILRSPGSFENRCVGGENSSFELGSVTFFGAFD